MNHPPATAGGTDMWPTRRHDTRPLPQAVLTCGLSRKHESAQLPDVWSNNTPQAGRPASENEIVKIST